MSYPESMRLEAIELHKKGYSIRAIANRLVFPSRMAVWRWIAGSHDGPCTTQKKVRERRSVKLPKVEGDGPIYPDIDPDDKDALIERLKLENDVLRAVNEVLKAASLRDLTNREKTLVINHLRRKNGHRLKELTAFLKISKSSYEYQCKAIAREEKYAWLRPLVRESFEVAGKSARGYRFVVNDLRRLDEPIFVSEKIVRRIMAEEGLVPLWMKKRAKKPFSSYAGEPTPAPDNLVARNFHSALPNFLWLTDITEFRLPSGQKVYLSALRDCFDSSIVSWRIGRHPDALLANEMLQEACEKLQKGEHPVIHSDRGGHYRWPGWIGICEKYGLVRSMSAKGCSADNAAMEGFFGLLKREFFHGRDWRGWGEKRFIAELDQWIRDYNDKRNSDALNYVTPNEYRNSLGRAA